MADLTPRQGKAFKLRYVEGLLLREVGERLGRVDGAGPICAENARQIVAKAHRRLQHPFFKGHPLRELAFQLSGESEADRDERWLRRF